MLIRDSSREETVELIDRFGDYCDELTGYLIEYSDEMKTTFKNQFMGALDMGMKLKVVEENGVVMGGIMYMEERTDSITGEKNGFVLNLLIFPEYRRRGLAKMLIEHTASELREKGIESIRLNVFANNKEAISFYDKIDFTPYSMIMAKKI